MIIYLLRNNVNGKCYVGQTAGTLDARWTKHVCLSKTANSYAIHRAIRKYGAETFERLVLASSANQIDLNRMEREYIAQFKAFGRDGYNETIGGDGVMRGRTHSPETRRKISAAQTGRKQSPELIAKRTASQVGRPLSAEHRAKLSAWQIGKVLSPEHRAKLSAAHKGKRHSRETLEKMSATRRGRSHTPEHCARISDALKNRARQSKAKAINS